MSKRSIADLSKISTSSFDLERVIKIVTHGNQNVSKRDLLLSYTNPNYPEDYELYHEFDPYSFTHCTILNKQQKKIILDLYDSSGLEDSPEVRRILNRRTDVFMLVYSILDRQSLQDIVVKWYPEVIDHCPEAVFILVATDCSKRQDGQTIANFFLNNDALKKPISREEGESMAQRLGFHRYCEVCVESHDGVWDVFDNAVREVMRIQQGSKGAGLYPVFCKRASTQELEQYISSKRHDVSTVIGDDRSSFSVAIEGKNFAFAVRILELENGNANMANSNLESIPEILIEWINQGIIKEINLDNNQLQMLPNELVNLKSVSVNGNPLLSIPAEFRTAKWKKLRQYLLSIAERTANWNIRKLILVGEEGVGKTTVAKCLGSKSGKVDTFLNLSTDGIDIQEIKIKKEKGNEKEKEKEFIFNTWDFGGQVVFYPTHQFFLSNGAIYLIVFDISNFKQSRIEYWMKQLKQLNGESSVIIMVGTHADQCKDEEITMICEKLLTAFPKRLFPAFQNIIIPLSCKTGLGVKQLKDTLIQLAEHPSLSSIVSESWVNFYELIKNQMDSGIEFTDWEAYQGWAESCGIQSYQLPFITEFLMKNGSILNFHDKLDKNLRELVILNPHWLAKIMACLITTKGNFVNGGYLMMHDVKNIFNSYPAAVQAPLLALLEKFKIIYPINVNGIQQILVPSLLPSVRPSSEIIKLFPTRLPIELSTFGRIFQFGQLPLGLVGRLMISLLRLPGAIGELFWRNGLIIDFESTSKLFLEYNGEEYLLEVQSRFPHNHKQDAIRSWRMILETIKTLIESFYPRLVEMKVESIPCIHCYKSGVYKEKVYFFPYNEVDNAVRNGEHFLYCNNIKSPYRTVLISDLAPDLGMFDIPRISEDNLVIEKLIGEGGFGKIYKGSIGSTAVAIKELKLSKNPEANKVKFQEFQTECYMMNILKHPNIVNLFGILMNPPRMVLQFISGGDLFQLLHKKNEEDSTYSSISQEEFQWERRYRIAMDIAKGLHYMQSLTPPVVHRDLRSPNIFLTEEGTAIIGDFGLARIVQTGEIGGLLGTWQWVAPEALNSSSDTYDQRSDIYSFGIILWELASIDTPFEEFTNDPRFFHNGVFKLIEIKQAIVDGLRPTIPKHTPASFASLISECWNGDVTKRPSTSKILTVLSSLTGDEVDDMIERRKLTLSNSIFVDTQYESEIMVLDKRDSKTLPLAVMKIDLNSREKFACLLIVNNNRIWVGSNQGSISIFEFNSGFQLIAMKKKQKKRISQLINVGNSVWSVSDDGTVNCWNINTLILEHEWMPLGDDSKSAATTTLLFPPSNDKFWLQKITQQVWFVSPMEGRVTSWSSSSREYIKSITHDELLGAMAMQFHRGCVWVAAGTSGNKICMYDAVTFDHIGSFIAHESRITSILSIGERIWTSAIEDIRVWNAASPDTLQIFKSSKIQQSKVECMLCTDKRVNVGTFDGTIFSFDVNSVDPQQEIVTNDSVRFLQRFSNSNFITLSQFDLSMWSNINDLYESADSTIEDIMEFEESDKQSELIMTPDEPVKVAKKKSSKVKLFK